MTYPQSLNLLLAEHTLLSPKITFLFDVPDLKAVPLIHRDQLLAQEQERVDQSVVVTQDSNVLSSVTYPQ